MIKVIQGDCRDVMAGMAEESVQCCVTSPPYWGLRKYAGIAPLEWADGWKGDLGLEPQPELYVEHIVEIMRAVKRVLRKDGTLWLNLGDCFWGGKGQSNQNWSGSHLERDTLEAPQHHIAGLGETRPTDGKHAILKPKDLCGMPWRVAFALQVDGWWLRSAIVWAKGVSFCKSYAGSVMPESVNGTRWERHRVKLKAMSKDDPRYRHGLAEGGAAQNCTIPAATQWQDCPGCPKCEKNDGLILRRGSGRPTRAYEMVFLLTKSARYWYDAEGVREPQKDYARGAYGNRVGCKDERPEPGVRTATMNNIDRDGAKRAYNPDGRNLRDVWVINPKPFKEAHFATFPPALVRPCVLAGTSPKACGNCGAPWARMIQKEELREHPQRQNRTVRNKADFNGEGYAERDSTLGLVRDNKTVGWRPTCEHKDADTGRCIVLDPFAGSGTVGLVCKQLRRDFIGIELSPEYVEMTKRRLAQPVTVELLKEA